MEGHKQTNKQILLITKKDSIKFRMDFNYNHLERYHLTELNHRGFFSLNMYERAR